ncbi:MAG: class I SAM-dependent methyltransferase [Planctomycetes bacterium]|nr:class I SAM-dependent methyltransferase [Planctomycetota bacterium]
MPKSLVIHPEDEMRLHLRTLGRPEEALFCEYMQTGFAVYAMIHEVVRRLGRQLEQVDSLLDFASGYGRVVRFLLDDLPATRVTVSDIYADAVRFQTEEFGVHGVVSKAEPDGLDLGGPHDLITCNSLFSHLPEPLFRSWLIKLAAALRDDGLLLFTTHGPHLFDGHFAGDFAFVPSSESRSLDVQTYGSAYVTMAHVERLVQELLPGRKLVASLARAANGHQDVYVVGPASMATITDADLSLPRVFVDGMVQQGDLVKFWGWAFSQVDGRAVRRLRAFVDHQEVPLATITGAERPDLLDHFPNASQQAGFEASFDLAQWMSRRVFALQAEDDHGLRARIFHHLPF